MAAGWAGMLPNGWSVEPLRTLATIQRGRFSARPRNDPKFYGGEIPFVQTGDVANAGRYLTTHSQTLNELGLAVSKVFPANTILMTIAANIGETTLTCYPVACPDSVVGILAKPERAHVGWLKYALEELQPELDRMAGQNAQKNINLQVLEPLSIRVPPMLEQERISDVLSTWDEAIATSERLLANSRRQKQTLVHRLFQQRRNGEMAQEFWSYVNFESLFERVTRKNTEGESNVLTISGERGLISQRDYFNKSVASLDLSGYTLLRRGEFAYNKSYSAGYPMGAIKPLTRYDGGVVSSLYICFRLREGVVADPDFFRHYFEAGLLNDELTSIAQEGARNHGLLNVGVGDFFRLRMHIPDEKEQRRIAKIINAAEMEEQLVSEQIQALRSEKRALMQQLLTGKRRLHLDMRGEVPRD